MKSYTSTKSLLISPLHLNTPLPIFVPTIFLCFLMLWFPNFSTVIKANNLSFEVVTLALNNDEAFANEIYEQLKNRIGDKRKEWPSLKIWGVNDQVASFIPQENTIYLDENAIGVCKTFGAQYADALAFIIGHELTHFYQEHDWKKAGFVSNFIISKKDFVADREHERQADIYGAFISEQAGYKSIKLIPSLLEKIYTAYELQVDATQKYPSLQDRKTLAAEACKVAGNLIDTYHTANYAMVLGKYEEAYLLYQYVSQHLKFKELYFNIGMSNLLGYYAWDIDNPLAYYFEIDPKIPLTRSDQMRHPSTLLKEAILAFQKVNQDFDPIYFPAKLHLITAYDWNGEIAKATTLIKQLEASTINKELAALRLTTGNLYSRNNQISLAKQQYENLLNVPDIAVNFSQLATANLKYLATGQNQHRSVTTRPVLKIEENIDQIHSLNTYNFEAQQEHQLISINFNTQINTLEGRNSYLTRLKFGDDLLKLQRIYSPAIKTNQGLNIGSDVSEVYQKYPNQVIGMVGFPNGYYLVNYEKGLIFKCNHQGVVEEWSLFAL